MRTRPKKNSLVLAGLLLLSACSSVDTYKKIRLEIPAYSNLRLDRFQELVVATFLTPKETAGVDLSKEIGQYFEQELERRFPGRVFFRAVDMEGEDVFQNPEFWKSLAQNSGSLLYFTGKADLSRETRKAVLSRPGDPWENELSPTRSIAERTVFVLDITIHIINAASGEILVSKTYKESKTYVNPAQRADFALFDLIQRVKQKLFRPILGEERIQERYLLAR
jgi:hypothetical protein